MPANRSASFSRVSSNHKPRKKSAPSRKAGKSKPSAKNPGQSSERNSSDQPVFDQQPEPVIVQQHTEPVFDQRDYDFAILRWEQMGNWHSRRGDGAEADRCFEMAKTLHYQCDQSIPLERMDRDPLRSMSEAGRAVWLDRLGLLSAEAKTLVVDRDTLSVRYSGLECFLGYTNDFRLIERLAACIGKFLTVQRLKEDVWTESDPEKSTVQKTVSNLRVRLHLAGLGDRIVIDGSERDHYRLILR